MLVKIKKWASSLIHMPMTLAVLISMTATPVRAEKGLLHASREYKPFRMKGLTYNPQNLFEMEFIFDRGKEEISSQHTQQLSQDLMHYFLSSLSIPQNQLWVNLSPYEPDRILPPMLAQTKMGITLLDLDSQLKRLVSTYLHPDYEVGEEFWETIQDLALGEFGNADIPTETFNKVWIVPDKAKIRVNESTVYVVNSRLKVMLEEDYLSVSMNRYEKDTHRPFPKNASIDVAAKRRFQGVPQEVFRKLIIPQIEKEVNEGENFAQLRQVLDALILGTWFRDNLLGNLIEQAAALEGKGPSKPKEEGASQPPKKDSSPPKGGPQKQEDHFDFDKAKMEIYEQYLAGYQEGVFNLIKDEYDPVSDEVIKRKYASGGVRYNVEPQVTEKMTSDEIREVLTTPKVALQGILNLFRGFSPETFINSITDGPINNSTPVGGIDLDTMDMEYKVSGEPSALSKSALRNLRLPLNALAYEVLDAKNLKPNEVMGRLGLRKPTASDDDTAAPQLLDSLDTPEFQE